MPPKKKNGPVAEPPRETPPPAPPRARKFVIAAVAVIAIAAGAFFVLWRSGKLGGGGNDPDIILVTIDTLRVDCVSFTGSNNVKTPFLDELARSGIYFQNAHSHNVVTFPSHSNILTGLLPYQHGVRDNAGFTLDPKHKTVAAYLKQHGYVTAAFVAAFPLNHRFGLGADFDVYDDSYHKGVTPTAFTVPERPASEVFAAAQKWYDSVPAGQKKFLWVHIYEPHMPYEPPSPFKEMYPKNPYYGEVATADNAVGKFLRPLLAKHPNTFLVLTGDHGEGFGEHGEYTHSVFAYEETLHIPLIVVEKGRIRPHVEKRYVRHIDIVPTILARVGIEKPKELTGESLLALDKPRNTYFEALSANVNLGWAPLLGMIHDGHKYIDLPIAELYDLNADPHEKKNILKEDRRMTTRVRTLLASTAPAVGKMERDLSPEEAKKLLSLGYLAGTAAEKKEYTERDDPKNVVHLYMAMLQATKLAHVGKMKEAMEVAQKLIAERPEMGMARDLLASLLQQSNREEDAEKVIRDAMAKGIATDTMRKRLGMLLSESGRAAEAVQVLAPFAESKDPELLNAYGIALGDVGHFDEAVQQFQRALQIDRKNAQAFQNLGILALRTGNAGQAQQYLNRALELNDRLPLAYNTLGGSYVEQNDYIRAINAWKRAVTLDPKQYDAMFNLGLVAGRAGQLDEARRALEQFVRTAPPARYGKDIATAKQALVALR
jgi:choline-sulfatase